MEANDKNGERKDKTNKEGREREKEKWGNK